MQDLKFQKFCKNPKKFAYNKIIDRRQTAILRLLSLIHILVLRSNRRSMVYLSPQSLLSDVVVWMMASLLVNFRTHSESNLKHFFLFRFCTAWPDEVELLGLFCECKMWVKITSFVVAKIEVLCFAALFLSL